MTLRPAPALIEHLQDLHRSLGGYVIRGKTRPLSEAGQILCLICEVDPVDFERFLAEHHPGYQQWKLARKEADCG